MKSGKTTILKIMGGKHMVRVLGRSAFHDTGLTSSEVRCESSNLFVSLIWIKNADFD